MPGSKKTTETSQATSSNQIDPRQLKMLENNYATAQTGANSITPYTGQLTAGFTPTQIQAQGILGNIAHDTSGQSNIATATDAVKGILGYSPDAITAAQVTPQSVTAPTISAGQLSGADLSPYMNPYQSSVIDTTLSQNERARQMAQADNARRATASGAFGGSRSAVLDSLTNGEYDRNNASTIANLNAQNFNQAQNAAVGDISRRLTADQFNAGNAMTAAQGNQAADLNAQQFNSQAGTNAQQATINNALQAYGLTMNAAGQIVALNNAGLADATARAGILSSVGDAQQQQQQSALDRSYADYLQQNQNAVTRQGILNSALGLIPTQQTTTANSSSQGKTTSSPGLTDILNSLGSLAQGVSKFGH